MAYNMHYMDQDTYVTLDRVYDHVFGDEYMIANRGGKYALNSLHGQVINLQSVDCLETRETWDISRSLIKNQY